MHKIEYGAPAEGLPEVIPTMGELNELAMACDADELPAVGQQFAVLIENNINVAGSENGYVFRALRMLSGVEGRALPPTIRALSTLVMNLDVLEPKGFEPYAALRRVLKEVEILALDPETPHLVGGSNKHKRYRDQVAERLRVAYQTNSSDTERLGIATGSRLPLNAEMAESLTTLRHASLLGPWEASEQPRQRIYNALHTYHQDSPDVQTPTGAVQTLADAQPDILAKVLTLDLVKDDQLLADLHDQLGRYQALLNALQHAEQTNSEEVGSNYAYAKIRDGIASLYETVTFGRDFAGLPTQQRYDDSPLTQAYKEARATLTLAADWLLLHDHL